MSMFTEMAQGAMWADLVRVHGIPVIYKALGQGAGTTFDAIWTPGAVMVEYAPDGIQDKEVGILKASPSDITSPDLSDTFVIDSGTWAVVGTGRSQPFIELQLEKREQTHYGGDAATIKR